MNGTIKTVLKIQNPAIRNRKENYSKSRKEVRNPFKKVSFVCIATFLKREVLFRNNYETKMHFVWGEVLDALAWTFAVNFILISTSNFSVFEAFANIRREFKQRKNIEKKFPKIFFLNFLQNSFTCLFGKFTNSLQPTNLPIKRIANEKQSDQTDSNAVNGFDWLKSDNQKKNV